MDDPTFTLAQRYTDGNTYSCPYCARYSTSGHSETCPITVLRAERDRLREALERVERDCDMPVGMIASTLSAHRATAQADHEYAARCEAALREMREWHRIYHGEDPCRLCLLADAALAHLGPPSNTASPHPKGPTCSPDTAKEEQEP
jgi:hypothetical protein